MREAAMKNFVVGGRFEDESPRSSGVATKLAELLEADFTNGGSLADLSSIDLSGRKLVVWVPDLDNRTDKIYPHKDQGSTLVCSKVMRKGYTSADAIARIFKMHANAVIEVYPTDKPFKFRLLDALGNEWSPKSSDLSVLAEGLLSLHKWTQGSIRVRTTLLEARKGFLPWIPGNLVGLSQLNREVADRIESEVMGRYFGNTSTRCMSLFPSSREGETGVYVSARNLNKKRITEEDYVLAHGEVHGPVFYYGPRKPSVDTPVQLGLYSKLPQINFMIHGHAFVEGSPMTEHYFPCGDLREMPEAEALMKGRNMGVINLKNHGFLMFSDTLANLRELAENSHFYRDLPI